MTPNPVTCDNTQIINDYVRYKRYDWPRKNTVRTRRYQLAAISDAFPQLVTASEDDLLRWHDGLTGSAVNVAQYTSVARGLFEWMATVARLRLDNPAAVLRRPRIPPRAPRPMLDRHYEWALACALSDPEMYLWLGLMGCSGFRCCEVAWANTLDFEPRNDGGGIARVVGKGGKRRPIPVGAMLMLTLKPFLIGRGPVFTRASGLPYTPKQISEKVNDFLRGLDIPETAHSIRHRFGTDYHALDSDLYRQAKVMGHESVETTQLYTEVDPIEAAIYIEQLTRRRLHRPAA
jgi:site-specific recombinase XerC